MEHNEVEGREAKAQEVRNQRPVEISAGSDEVKDHVSN